MTEKQGRNFFEKKNEECNERQILHDRFLEAWYAEANPW
jgi:hypothetical protein